MAMAFVLENNLRNASMISKPQESSPWVGLRLLKIPFADAQKDAHGKAFQKTISVPLKPAFSKHPQTIVAVGSLKPSGMI